MSLVYIDNLRDLDLVLEKEVRPYYKSSAAPKFGLDFETTTLLDNKNDYLFKVPQPIRIPARMACSLLTRQELLMEHEGFTALMQLGADPAIYDRQWLIDTKKIDVKYIATRFKGILETSYILGHSLRYEYSYLCEQFDIFLDPEKILDIRIIDQLLTAGTNYSTGLIEAYRRYIDYGLFIMQTMREDGAVPGMNFNEYADFKDEMQKSEWGGELARKQLWYGADDVRLPFFAYQEMKDRLRKHYKIHPKSNLLKRIKLECAVVPESALMFLRGVDFNSAYHNGHVVPYLEKKAEEELEKVQETCPNPNPSLERGIGRGKKRVFYDFQAPFNPRSPAQIIGSMKLLGLNLPNTTEQTLKEHRHESMAIEHILRYKKAANMLSKFGYELPKFVHEDGKIHADFGQIGTETLRFAYWGPNLQQVPNKETLFGEIKSGKLFRTAFTCHIGEYILIDCDLPNIEPRLISEASGEITLITAFRSNTDYHGLTAKILMGLEEYPIKGSWHREKVGKIGNLSLGYGASWKTLKDNMLKFTLDDETPIRWTDDEAKEKHAAYFRALPAVAAKIEEIRHRVERALEHHDSLADFAGGRPIFEIFSEWPKVPERSHMSYRGFYLMDWQQRLAEKRVEGDPRRHPLHKHFQVIEYVYELDEHGKPILDEKKQPRRILDPVTGEPKTKRHFYNTYKKALNDISREAYNFMIQAEGACILKRIIVLLGQRLRDAGFPLDEGLIITIHDELLLRVHKSRAVIASRILKECMEEACREVITEVPVECDPGEGETWAEAAL